MINNEKKKMINFSITFSSREQNLSLNNPNPKQTNRAVKTS